MDQIKNKELLAIAINDYDSLTKSQKAIINVILDFEEMGNTKISISSIIELTGFSSTVIYQNINKLVGMEILSKYKKRDEKNNYFELNENKLRIILDIYMKKQQILQKKLKKNNKNS